MHKKNPKNRQVLLLDIQLWLKVAFLFFCLLNYSRKVALNHHQLHFAGWVLLKCDDGDADTQLRHDAVQIFTVEQMSGIHLK